MKRYIVLVLVLASLVLGSAGCGGQRVAVPTGAYRQPAAVDIGFFYDELGPYGRWLQVEEYGWVWTPYGVPGGWRPYTNGYWVWTEYGWTWVSRWRWGWAPFHYGRWTLHRQHGWFWVPGTTWGPAWVCWRHGPGRIGWAPLPPRAHWRAGVGLSMSNADMDREIDSQWYSFVDERHLTDRDLDRRIEVSSRNVTLLRETQIVTNYTEVDRRVINHGVGVEQIEKATGRKVASHKIVDVDSPARSDQVKQTEVGVFRPKIEEKPPARAPRTVDKAPPPTPAAELERKQEKQQRKLEAERETERKKIEKQQRKQQAEQEKERKKVEKKQRKEQKKPPEVVTLWQPQRSVKNASPAKRFNAIAVA